MFDIGFQLSSRIIRLKELKKLINSSVFAHAIPIRFLFLSDCYSEKQIFVILKIGVKIEKL